MEERVRQSERELERDKERERERERETDKERVIKGWNYVTYEPIQD